MKEYRFILVPYNGPQSREECPSCGQEFQFTRYMDKQTGEVLPPHVGRCNREDQCGYHYTPKQYFAEVGITSPDNGFTNRLVIKREVPTDYLPDKDLIETLDNNKNNNLFSYFTDLFGESTTIEVFEKYIVGTSNHRWEGATIFWQVDISGNIRQCKVMLYDPSTGKRLKKGSFVNKYNWKRGGFVCERTKQDCVLIYGKYLNGSNNSLNLQQCFFGEQLLTEYPNNTVAIVESEKTAMIANVYLPEYVWIATGGTHGCKWTDANVYKVLENRKIVLFPDASIKKGNDKLTAFEKWVQRVKIIQQQTKCMIYVSDLLEQYASTEEKREGWDIADYLISKNNQK